MTLDLTDLDKLGQGFGTGTYAQDIARFHAEHGPSTGDGRVYVVKDALDLYIEEHCPAKGGMSMSMVLKNAKRFYDAQEAWRWACRSIYPALPVVLDEETEALILAKEAAQKARDDAPAEVWMKSFEIPTPEGLDPALYLATLGIERRDDQPLSEDEITQIERACTRDLPAETAKALETFKPLLAWRDNLTDAWGEDLAALLLSFVTEDEPDARMGEEQLMLWHAYRKLPDDVQVAIIERYTHVVT